MPLFVEPGTFTKDYTRPGPTVRNLLRLTDAENKLALLRPCLVVRHKVNRGTGILQQISSLRAGVTGVSANKKRLFRAEQPLFIIMLR